LFSIKRRKLETIPWHKANPDLTALQVPDSCMNPVHTVSHVPDCVFVNPRKRKRLQDNSTVSFIHDNGNAVIRNASSAFHNHDVNDKRINVHGVYDFFPWVNNRSDLYRRPPFLLSRCNDVQIKELEVQDAPT
jgi:hypothetical protein